MGGGSFGSKQFAWVGGFVLQLVLMPPNSIGAERLQPSLNGSASFLRASPSAAGIVTITSDGSRIFAANPGSGSVSAVDTRTDEKVEIPVGEDPRVLALSGDGGYLYVTCQGSATLAVLSTSPLSVLRAIEVGAEPAATVNAASFAAAAAVAPGSIASVF